MSNGATRYRFYDLTSWLFSPKLTVVCLAFLMALTFWGTLYQVEHGLYAAQERFYNSYGLLLGGFLPFPGTQLVLAVLLANLLGYLVKMLLFERLKPGIVLIHLGILLLLLGGAITHHFAEESQLTLLETESANVSAAYNDWEIALWTQDGARRSVWAADANNLAAGDVLTFDELGIQVEVETYHQNARAFQSGGKSGLLNRMGITSLEPAKPEKEPAQNIAGGIFSIHAAGGRGVRVLLFGEDISPEPIAAGDRTVVFALRHRRHPLPVTMSLLDFQREMHPGTDMAQSFSSKVSVESDGVERTMTISMNKPLRHRGYTLYQASYTELPNGLQSSTFAVARNYGRLIPYIATSVVVIGMIVHFLVMMVQRAARRERRA